MHTRRTVQDPALHLQARRSIPANFFALAGVSMKLGTCIPALEITSLLSGKNMCKLLHASTD